MSIINQLGADNKNLLKILKVYDNELLEAQAKIEIKGKLLEQSISENSADMHYYDQRKIELHTLIKHFEMEEKRIRGKLYRQYNDNSKYSLGEREINKYIDNEEAYLNNHSLLIEIEEVYEQYRSIVLAFEQRNYSLTNITKIRVAQLEFIEI